MNEQQYRVLVAEKDDYLREKMAGVLSRLGTVQMVTQVNNLDSMVAASEFINPDVCYIDIKLAVGNESAIREFRQLFNVSVLALLLDYEISDDEMCDWRDIFDDSVLKAKVFKSFDKTLKMHRKVQEKRALENEEGNFKRLG